MAAARALTTALICVLAASAGCRRDAPPPPVERTGQIVPVGAIASRTAPIRAVVRVSGVVVPAEGGEFLAVAPEPARIVDIAKSEGDQVASDDVLVRFDLPSAAQDLARLDADLAAAQAQLERARVNQSRVREFVDKGLVPRRDLDTADRELADAQAAVNRIRAAQAAAQKAAARAVIRAPFSGIVVTRRYAPGDLVTSRHADAVLRVVDPRRLDVVAQVPRAEIARVVPGATARIAGPAAGEPVRLTVAGRLPVDPGTGDLLPVRLTFVEPADLPVDTRVEIDIDAEERLDALFLPAEAILQDAGQSVVFVASGSTAQRRVVTTGITDGTRVEITDGVKPGELVINRGHVGLIDGDTISVDVAR